MAKTKKKTAGATKSRSSKTAGRSSSSPGRARRLVIVESPAKAKTINRYLGEDYLVKASMGHVRDLPKKNMGVDIEHGFEPTYELLASRKKIISELKKYAKTAPEIYLATDLDREGEAIAWHVAESLSAPRGKIRRVVFNEITSGAIREAFAHPRDIDMDKVSAQQARRVLDRIVGYELSPLLWRKVAPGLSAGRVQSVAVRLIVEREREIEAFIPEEYWRIEAVFTPDLTAAAKLADEWARFLGAKDEKGNGPTQSRQQEFIAAHGAFRAELYKLNGLRFKASDAEMTLQIAKALGLEIDRIDRTEEPKAKEPARNKVTVAGKVAPAPPEFIISSLKSRDRQTRPYAPFTTATMQQTAAVQMRFSASRTMRAAQRLYEGINVPGEGTVGLITYMRTDSTHLAAEAISQVRSLIAEKYGREYLPEKARVFTTSGRAQEAHEAIRPTDVSRTPEQLRDALDNQQFRLYELIWKRFVACQMTAAIWKITEAEVTARTPEGEAIFKAVGRQLSFDGFLRVAGLPRVGDQILPKIASGKPVAPVEISPTQHFTQPPPRYTEASLIKALEADGIGRPSTYAAIIQTIQNRRYVKQAERTFHPTHLGIVVTDKLVKHFPRIFDVRFTAHMEDQLDRVEAAQTDWVRVLEEFYKPFSDNLSRAVENMVHAKAETQPSEYKCDKCGKAMVYRFSRTGRYLACTGYPDCKQTYPVDEDGRKIERVTVNVACPKCGEPMIQRQGRFGPFLSCLRYPECDGIVNLDKKKGFVKLPSPPPLEVDVACPKCQSQLNLRRSKRGPWLSCSKFPKCRGRAGWIALDEAKRKELEAKLVAHEKANPQPVIRTLDGTVIGAEFKPEPVEDKAIEDQSET